MTTWTNAIAAAIAASVVLLAVPAAAVDGERLITQGRVNAGGIAPGDAPGFPATLSRPGRYKLAGNLAVPAGNIGIEVTQSDVTIDFNGFTVRSNPPGQGSIAIASDVNVSRLRVANGTITGFGGFTIFIEGALAVVENMRIIGTAAVSSCGVCGGATQARIRNNTIANALDGIRDCHGCLIEQNIITGNAGRGVYLLGGLALGNLIAGNGSYGLVSGFDPAAGYGDNVLFGNNGGGAQVLNAVQLHPNICNPACP